MIFNYEKPIMVKFKEHDQEPYEPMRIGIAYYNEVICMECGSAIPCGNIDQLVVIPWKNPSQYILDLIS
jgi:hypothetical protein